MSLRRLPPQPARSPTSPSITPRALDPSGGHQPAPHSQAPISRCPIPAGRHLLQRHPGLEWEQAGGISASVPGPVRVPTSRIVGLACRNPAKRIAAKPGRASTIAVTYAPRPKDIQAGRSWSPYVLPSAKLLGPAVHSSFSIWSPSRLFSPPWPTAFSTRPCTILWESGSARLTSGPLAGVLGAYNGGQSLSAF